MASIEAQRRIMRRIGDRQVVATQANGKGVGEGPEMFFIHETVRESILGQAIMGGARLRLWNDTFVVLTQFGDFVAFVPIASEPDLFEVVGVHNGSEEYDGEDSGTYRFWMNRSSLAALHDRFKAKEKIDAELASQIIEKRYAR